MFKQILYVILLIASLTVSSNAQTSLSTKTSTTKTTVASNNRYAATIESAGKTSIFLAKGETATYAVKITNTGTRPLNRIYYQIQIDDTKQEPKLFRIGKNIEPNKSNIIYLPLSFNNISGQHKLLIHLTKVNIKDCTTAPCEGNITILSRKVNRKPCFEEYTAMGCGWCPRGIVAFEKSQQVWSDSVTLIAIHGNDAMICDDYEDVTVKERITGLPTISINRQKKGDPWNDIFGCKNKRDSINVLVRSFAPASINMTVELDKKAQTLTVYSDTRYLYTGKVNTALAFVLVHDGMSHPAWFQHNYYVNRKEKDPLFDRWTNGTNPMRCVWDHVAIGKIGGIYGIKNSIPSNVIEEEPIENKVIFNLNKYPQIQDTKKLFVIALLIDKNTGEIIHSEYGHYNTTEDIKLPSTETQEIARYNIEGRLLKHPEKGINFIINSDGKVNKIMVK